MVCVHVCSGTETTGGCPVPPLLFSLFDVGSLTEPELSWCLENPSDPHVPTVLMLQLEELGATPGFLGGARNIVIHACIANALAY